MATVYNRYYPLRYTISIWFESDRKHQTEQAITRARQALEEARREFGPDAQLVARDWTGAAKRFGLCTWRVLYDILGRELAPRQRHFHAMFLEEENYRGLPLVVDMETSESYPGTRPAFLQGVRDVVAWLRRELARCGGDAQAPIYVDDVCAPTGEKQSVHLLCRAFGFRTTAAAHGFVCHLQLHVPCAWIDVSKPSRNGCFKLVGNCKLEEVDQNLYRAQRPNPELREDLSPLMGYERWDAIVSWDEFWARRTWLDAAEADDPRLVWPTLHHGLGYRAPPPLPRAFDWLSVAALWPLDGCDLQFQYVDEHGDVRRWYPPVHGRRHEHAFENLAALRAQFERLGPRYGQPLTVAATPTLLPWLVLQGPSVRITELHAQLALVPGTAVGAAHWTRLSPQSDLGRVLSLAGARQRLASHAAQLGLTLVTTAVSLLTA